MSLAPDPDARAKASQAMDRYADGDEAAFGELYDVLAPPLYRFARNLTRRDAQAEDLVQQTFLQLHRSRARWVRGARLFPWAWAIARHLFIDSTRRREPQPAPEPERVPEEATQARAADDGLDDRRRLEAVLSRIEQLPENQRIAFQLVVLEELSVQETAEVLGFTTSNVKVLVHRARERLRDADAADARLACTPFP